MAPPPSPPSHGDDETPFSTPKFRPNSRRSSSFSSDSSLESTPFFLNINASPPHSPITPLNLIRIPFSWEQSPGIPKNHNKTQPSGHGLLLPLPPAGAAASAAKKHPKKDPFFAAMIECSKDGHDDGANIWKGGLSDRFGFISMYSSCKKTCAVSGSIVYVPRAANPHYLLHRHRRAPVKP